jgi:hypothetical protein
MQHRSNGHSVGDLGAERRHGQGGLHSTCDEHVAAADERPAKRGKLDRGRDPLRTERA